MQKGYFYLYLAALIWGSLGVFARLSGMPPVELAFYRLLLAGLLLSLFLPRETRLATGGLRAYLLNCGAGVLFAVDCVLFFHALRLTTLSNTVFPYNLQPVFMIILSGLLPGEKDTPGSMRFIFFALCGLVLLFVPSLLAFSPADILGLMLSLAGAFCLAGAALIARRVPVSSLIFVYYEIVVAALCLVPFMRHYTAFPPSSYLWVAVTGLVHTAFAYVCYYEGLRTVKPAQAIAIIYFTPVLATLCGYLFFQESISLFTLAGGAVITVNGLSAMVAQKE